MTRRTGVARAQATTKAWEAADLAHPRTTAAGARSIPWHIDLDRTEEDLFHLLVAPPARILAGQWRAAGRPPLNRLFELFGGPEGHLLARLYLQRFSRCRIATRPRGTLPDLQGAKSGHPDPRPALKMRGHGGYEVRQKSIDLLLRQLMGHPELLED
jgi:hypothetical protein